MSSTEMTPNANAMLTKPIITELTVEELKQLQTSMGQQHLLIIKFSAVWCGPCKKIAPLFHDFINNAAPNIIFAEIDVDESIDLYISLKKQKMVSGIPAIFAYYGSNKQREKWFIPDDSVIGADETAVRAFFERCRNKK